MEHPQPQSHYTTFPGGHQASPKTGKKFLHVNTVYVFGTGTEIIEQVLQLMHLQNRTLNFVFRFAYLTTSFNLQYFLPQILL